MMIFCPKSRKSIRTSETGSKGLESRLLTEFDEISKIGSGGYGMVVKCMNKLDRKEYAIKKIILDADEACYDIVINEVLCLAEISHNNIVRYYSAWIEPSIEGLYEDSDESVDVEDESDCPCLFIQLELCNTSLDKLLEERKMEVEELWGIFKQLVHGLDHIHSRKIRHGDLKPSNVFLKEKVIKIGDFGLACSLKQAANVPIARGVYTAPELKSPEKPFTLKSDMFSLGMVLLEMLAGFGFGTSQEKFEVLGDPNKRDEYLVKACLDDFKEDIIRSLLNEDFNERPNTSMILELLEEDT